MPKELRYGDQVYIEFHSTEPSLLEKHLLICSNGFIHESLIAVEANNPMESSFINCVFTILPCLVDIRDETELLDNLQNELDLMLPEVNEIKQTTNMGYSTIRKNILNKKNELKKEEKSLDLLNEKIINESIGKGIRFGEALLFQHILSGAYLCASQTPHPRDRNLLNLSLSKETRQDCYFRILNFHENARDGVEYESHIRIVSIRYDTQIALGQIIIEKESFNNLSIEIEESKSDIDEDTSVTTPMNEIKYQPIFPIDLNIKKNGIETFNGGKFSIGMQFENENPTPVKFVEYCSRLDLDKYQKNKSITNANFIRLQTANGYLTGNNSSNNEHDTLTIDIYYNDEYHFDYVNTIFQIISFDNSNVEGLPLGTEIYANSKKIQNIGETSKVILKHFHSGYTVCNERGDLYVKKTNTIGDESETYEDDVPLIELISFLQEDDYQPINKSTSVTLRVYENKLNTSRFITERDNVQQSQRLPYDIVNNYYCGYNETDKILKSILKASQKKLELNTNYGVEFKLLPVPDNEMIQIMEIEAYVNNLKIYLKKIHNIILSGKHYIEELNFQTKNLLYLTEKFLIFFKYTENDDFPLAQTSQNLNNMLINTSSNFKQVITRELKAIDLLSMILYHGLVDEYFSYSAIQKKQNLTPINTNNSEASQQEVDNALYTNETPLNTPLVKNEKFDYEKFQQMMTIMIRLLIEILKDNQLNQQYCYQFLKIFLHGFVDPNGMLAEADPKIYRDIRQALMELISGILENAILPMNVFEDFETKFFNLLERKEENFNYINVNFLNFLFKLKAPAIQQTIAKNFIDNYLDNAKKRELFLPRFESTYQYTTMKSFISVYEEENDSEVNQVSTEYTKQEFFYAVLTKYDTGAKIEVTLNDHNNLAKYIIGIFELLNSLTIQNSLKFSQIIIEYYPVATCLQILDNNKVISQMKDEISKLLKNIHYSYTLLPIRKIPNEVQLLFSEHKKYKQIAETIIKKATEELICKAEVELLIQRQLNQLLENDVHSVSSSPTKKIGSIDYRDINIRLEEDFENQSYKIHLIENTLAGSYMLSAEKLLTIHNNIGRLLKLMIETPDELGFGEVTNPYINHAETIFSIIELVDDHVIRLSLLQTFKHIRKKLIVNEFKQQYGSQSESFSLFAGTLTHPNHSTKSMKNLEEEISERLSDAFSEGWRSKKNLYDIGQHVNVRRRHESTPEVYLEDRIITFLWKLIEKNNIKLASLAIQALQRKSKFESRVLNELNRWSIISSSREAEKIIVILESLLKCHQIARRLKVIYEFNVKKIDNTIEEISKVVLNSLENIITSIYDYHKHIGKTIENEIEPRKLFLLRLKESKQELTQEKPFVLRDKCIKTEFQKILANFNAHDILIPMIFEFIYPINFIEDSPDFVLIYRYIIIILMIFVKDNPHNQNLLANNKNLEMLISDDKIVEVSNDMLTLFYELCNKNKKLLKLELPHIHQMVQKYFFNQQNLLEAEQQQSAANGPSKFGSRRHSRTNTFAFKGDFLKHSKVKYISRKQSIYENIESHTPRTFRTDLATPKDPKSILNLKLGNSIQSRRGTVQCVETSGKTDEPGSNNNNSNSPFFLSINLKQNRRENRTKPEVPKVNLFKNINKIRILPLIFNIDFPKESFDIDNMMLDKLYSLDEFLNSNDWFSLFMILSSKPILKMEIKDKGNHNRAQLDKSNVNNTNNTINTMSNSINLNESSLWDRYELPVQYLLVKEIIKIELTYAESNVKNRIIFMQNKRQAKDFLNYLNNKNVEYHFDIKSIILNLMEALFYNKFKKPKVFDTIEDFDKFFGYLILDLISYIAYQGDNDLEFLGKDCFLYKYTWIKNRMTNISKLFKSYPYNLLNKITFLEYQYDIYYLDSWKKYIFYHAMNIFINILTYDSEYMLNNKAKNQHENTSLYSYFDIWFEVIKKLAKIEKDEKYIRRLLEVIKKVALIPEFSAQKESLTSFKNSVQGAFKKSKGENSKIKSKLMISNFVTTVFTKFDLKDMLKKRIQLGMKSSLKCGERNIRELAAIVSESDLTIKRLVKFIHHESKETSIKNIIFVLRLLRKIIEIQNPRVNDFGKSIYEWDDLSSEYFKKIVIVQDKLKKHDIIKALYNLFLNLSHNQKVITETFELSISLLYGGNKDIQDLFYQEFLNDNENELIQYLATMIDHIFTKTFSSEVIRNKILYFRSQNFIYDYFEIKGDFEKLGSGYKEELATQFYESLAEKQDENIKNNPDFTLLMIILKFMQCLCENHHTAFQEFLTNQVFDGKVHSQSFNFTAYFRTTYQRCMKILNIQNIDIAIKLVDLLIEILQGESQEITNLMLRKTLLTDLCQTLTCYDNDLDLLPRGFGFNKHNKKLEQLKTKCVILLKSLLERSDSSAIAETSKYYDVNRLISFMTLSFQKYIAEKGELPNYRNINIPDYFGSPYLMDGIRCYIILKYLWGADNFNFRITESLEKLGFVSQQRIQMDYMIKEFCSRSVVSIEIFNKKTNQILRIYFPLFVVFDYLTLEIKNNFTDNVDRSNMQTKVEEFMEAIDTIITQIYEEYNSRNRFLGLNMYNMYKWLRIATNIIALLANLINLITLSYCDLEDTADIQFVTQELFAAQIVMYLGIINGILSLVLLIIWRYSQMNKVLKSSWAMYNQQNIKECGNLPSMTEAYMINNSEYIVPPKEICKILLKLVEPYSEVWQIARSKASLFFNFKSLTFLLSCKSFLWHALYLFTCFGSAFHPIICAIQLWDIVVRSDTVNRLATAVISNARQFFWTVVLLFTTVYIYSLIGLFYLNDEFIDDGVRLCTDEYSCFLVNLNYGLRSGGGIAELLSKPVYDPHNREIYLLRVIFDLSFFIIVIILMMNLIFGMIIDSFGELRDEKTKNEDDMNNICFICGIPRSEIERYFEFKQHVDHEHNMWYYLAYIIYIQEKNQAAPTELTEIESYVLDRYSKKDHVWLPIGRSLTLEKIFEQGEKQKKSEIDVLKEEMTFAIESLTKENKLLTDELKEMKGFFADLLVQRKFLKRPSSTNSSSMTISQKKFQKFRPSTLWEKQAKTQGNM